MNITTESSYYRLAVSEGRELGREEGKVEEARRLVLRLARARFGAPSPEVLAVIAAIGDLERLEALGDRLLTSASWSDLLAE